ncbi:hypothetical protein [Azorhizophilus paspali]|uniref:Uncharacterized protein n=1 Tax=Azorhizophilus paspali TaxID=69963 RepID=A0ABV6SLN9_AZOPA
MRFLLVYKGNYLAELRGPELRYLSLARELVRQGHDAVLAGRSADDARLPSGVRFVAVTDVLRLIASFALADVIVLHGGGPVLLFLALAAGFGGKTLVLDGYVPHWIELDALMRRNKRLARVRILIKSHFNAARNLLGGLTFNGVIVANKRQLDLFRGSLAPFFLTREFKRISIIPFGCDSCGAFDRERGKELLGQLAGRQFQENDFLVGWLGGVYGWFDLDSVMRGVSRAIVENRNIKIIFFGADEFRQAELLRSVGEEARANVVFMPWVEFSRRFEYWAGLDVSLVWGAEGYENDYASRTRNFDCLTLGLPIVQNMDDEWGVRLEREGAGLVVDRITLGEALSDLSRSPERLSDMRRALRTLAPRFSWTGFAERLGTLVSESPMTAMRRVAGLIGFVLVVPALLLFFTYALVKVVSKTECATS